MMGRFISFEGPEGGGKSTQAKALAARLEAMGIEVILTREPGGTRLAELIRTLVKEELEDAPVPRAETLLFLAARAQVCAKVVEPALSRGAWVVTDRFEDSTFAYQGYGRGLDVELLRHLNTFATVGRKPDITFLLDVPPEVSQERLKSREAATSSSADRIESAGAAFHQRLRDGFLKMAAAEPDRIRLVDASRSVQEVESEIWKLTRPLIS